MNGFSAGSGAPAPDLSGIGLGFGDPVHEAQRCFRTILDAMAHPGKIFGVPVSPAAPATPLGKAGYAVALTLCDLETPIWLDDSIKPARAYLRFHCGAPVADNPAKARFAFIGEPQVMPPLEDFSLGSDEYPERSATLVIEVPQLSSEGDIRLSGPGLPDSETIGVRGLPPCFWDERLALSELFPRGVDVIFTAGDRLACLPRSTRIDLLRR